jgi:hypothetical protein
VHAVSHPLSERVTQRDCVERFDVCRLSIESCLTQFGYTVGKISVLLAAVFVERRIPETVHLDKHARGTSGKSYTSINETRWFERSLKWSEKGRV